MFVKIGSIVAYESITTDSDDLQITAIGKLEVGMQLVLRRFAVQSVCPHNEMASGWNNGVTYIRVFHNLILQGLVSIIGQEETSHIQRCISRII